jgi:hypothetical protein
MHVYTKRYNKISRNYAKYIKILVKILQNKAFFNAQHAEFSMELIAHSDKSRDYLNEGQRGHDTHSI